VVSRRAATAARVLSGGKDFELCDPASLPGPSSPLFTMDISTPTVLTSDLASVMEPPMCRLAPKKTHIICTLGPSSRSVEDLENLLQAGMSVARFNFSHGTHEYHLETLENLRSASANTGRVCAVLLDTKGPEIRSGALVDGEPVRLSRGSRIELTTDYAHVGTNAKIAIS
jgi:pyruvate kinase